MRQLYLFECFPTSVFFTFSRHAQKIDQSGETRNSVSIRAFKDGGFSTLPLNISLHDYQTFAWRTSILSVKGWFILILPFLLLKK